MEKVIYRQLALPVSAFDYLKQFMRDNVAQGRPALTNAEALATILREHQQFTINEAREGRGHAEQNTRK